MSLFSLFKKAAGDPMAKVDPAARFITLTKRDGSPVDIDFNKVISMKEGEDIYYFRYHPKRGLTGTLLCVSGDGDKDLLYKIFQTPDEISKGVQANVRDLHVSSLEAFRQKKSAYKDRDRWWHQFGEGQHWGL